MRVLLIDTLALKYEWFDHKHRDINWYSYPLVTVSNDASQRWSVVETVDIIFLRKGLINNT